MPDSYGWDNMGANLQFFNLTGGSSGGGVTDVTATPPLTSSGGTTPDISTSMNTNRLIGRSSANVGVMEEIQVGDGLTLSGGVLTNTAISVSKSILIGNHGASTIATGVTSYGGFVKNNLTTAAQSFNVRTIMPTACVFRNWSVQIGTQPATGSCVFTMQIDAVDTAYTLTIAAGSVTGVYQNTIGSLNVANASAITYKITNNASTSTGAVVAVSIQVEI